MANLETLEIRVAANAESAAQGLSHLIGSLSALSRGVGKAVGGLQRLNTELGKIKGFSGMKLPGMLGDMTGSTSGANRTAKNIKQVNTALQEHINTVTGINRVSKKAKDSAKWMDQLLSRQELRSRSSAQTQAEQATQAAQSRIYYGGESARLSEERNTQLRMSGAQEAKELQRSVGEKQEAIWRQQQAIREQNANQRVAQEAETIRENQAIAETAQKAEQAVKATTESTKECINNANSLRDGFSNLTSGIGKFFGRIGRIASTMLIRKALKLMTAAAKEGTENLYQYSKGMNGEFAGAMDRMASSLAQMKNAAGTAIAPALSAIIPVLNAISGAAITAFNALSQLFALLGGASTWTRATAVVQDYADATKKAGGGGGGLKEMLADFDELNVIASEGGGGGGGGGSGIEYADMFEQVSTFSKEIRDIVGWIKENMNSILGIAAAIGTAMLAWKVSDAFSGLIGTLAGIIAGGAIIAVTCQVVWLMDNQYFKDKNVGWVIGDLLTTALGATLASKVIGSVLGSGWGTVAAGITLELSALTTIVALIKSTDTSALSREGIIAALTAGLKAGAGLVVLGKGLLSMTWAKAIMYAAGPAVMTVGAAIAVKAIAMFDNEGLSADVVKSGLLGALGIGVGTGILFKAFGYALATAGVAGLIAGGAAILTLGAIIGIKALLKPDTKEMKLDLTEEQVQAFVKEKMFSVDIDTVVKSINVTLDKESGLEESIRTQVQSLTSEMKVLSLGIDQAKTLENIKTIIGDANTAGSLVASVSELADAKIDTLKLTFANVKAYDASGNDITSSTLLSGIEGWNDVKNEMDSLGTELTEMMFKAAERQLTPSEEQYTQELLQKISNISKAITTSQVFGEAYTNLQLSLSDLSEDSASEVRKKFEEYSATLEESLRSAEIASINSYNQLAAYYEATGKPEIAEKYRQIAKDLADNMETSIKNSLDEATEPGKKLIREYVDNILEGMNDEGFQLDLSRYINSEGWEKIFEQKGITVEGFKDAINEVLMGAGVDPEVIDLMEVVGISGWDLLSEEVQRQIIQATKITPETMTVIKEALKLSATDIINIENWETFTSQQKLEFIGALIEAYGGAEALQAANNAGMNVGKEINKGLASDDAGQRAAAQKIVQSLQSQLDAMGVTVPVEVQALIDAVVNVTATSDTAAITSVTGSAATTQNNIRNTQSGSPVSKKLLNAAGAYDIPRGDVFIANEAGAELVGSINGKTSVANQGQIIEGIAGGVERANAEQNQLLREQNSLLRELLTKDNTVRIGASASLGRTVRQSLDMYSRVGG